MINIDEFIEKFKTVNEDIDYNLEYCLKLSDNYISDNKIIISFNTNKELVYKIADQLFDDSTNINKFIDEIYKNYSDSIIRQYVGFVDGLKEIYFEFELISSDNKMITTTWGLSYDEKTQKISKYILEKDNNEFLINFINTKFNLDITKLLQNYRYNKNGDKYHVFSLVNISEHKDLLINLCAKINNNLTIIKNFFDKHNDKKVTLIGFDINNDKVILNKIGRAHV